jgi:hypothetical protein
MLNQICAIVDPRCAFIRTRRAVSRLKGAMAAAISVAVLASPASAAGAMVHLQPAGNFRGFSHDVQVASSCVAGGGSCLKSGTKDSRASTRETSAKRSDLSKARSEPRGRRCGDPGDLRGLK